MRVLLVTFSDLLPFALTKVLNPALGYCAIVVDEPDISKKMLENYPSLRDKIFPFYELKECVENFHYDFILSVLDFRSIFKMANDYQKKGVAFEKLVNVCLKDNGRENDFLLKRALHYYQEHLTEFKIFATGLSYTRDGILPNQFDKKLFNFGRGGQDLYYDYQIAKFILEVCKGGGYIRYALIGLAPYSFNYDVSLSYVGSFRLPQYCMAFNDLHNFWMNINDYKKIFFQEYLNFQMPFDSIAIEDASGGSSLRTIKYINRDNRISAREKFDIWKNKNFPETKKENIKILDDYLTLCEKNNVRAIMFLPPFTAGYIKYFSRQKLDEFYYLIREAQKKHPSAFFFDGWKLQGFSDMDFEDLDHLNLNGAAKFSAIFNNFIESLEKG